MKKIISVLLASAMILPSASVFAFDGAPSLIYNNRELNNETYVPFITEGRTMLPFRYLLAEIGASVDYDEESRTVKAEKDGIAIAFSLDDTYIDITKDGKTERINQDVKNEIKEDRVYVPIRFLSEAFDLSVGWDNYERAAIIVDIPQYVKSLEEKAPDFKRYMEISSKLPQSYTQTASFKFNLDLAEGEEKSSIMLDAGYDLSLNEGAVSADVTADLNIDMPTVISMAKAIDLKGVTFSFKYNDGQFYAQTNLIDKLKEMYPDNEEIKSASLFVNSSTWFKADIKELFELLGLPTEFINVVKKGLGGNMTDEDFADIISSAYVQGGITMVEQAQAIDSVFEMYETIFKDAFTITENGEGSYDVELKLDKNAIIDNVLNSVGFNSDEMKNAPEYELMIEELNKAIVFDCVANVKIRNNIAEESVVKATFGMNYEGFEFNFDIEADSKLTPDTKKEITMPGTALNFIDIIKLFK